MNENRTVGTDAVQLTDLTFPPGTIPNTQLLRFEKKKKKTVCYYTDFQMLLLKFHKHLLASQPCPQHERNCNNAIPTFSSEELATMGPPPPLLKPPDLTVYLCRVSPYDPMEAGRRQ